jgi:hypothetical protein
MEWIVFAEEGFAQLYLGKAEQLPVLLAGTFTLWRLMASA